MHRLFKCCNCFHLLLCSKPHINNWIKEEKYSKKSHHDYIFRRHFEYYAKHAHNYCKCCKYISEHSANIVKNMIHLEIIKCFLCNYAVKFNSIFHTVLLLMHELGKSRKVQAFLLRLSVLSVSFAIVSVILILRIILSVLSVSCFFLIKYH